MPRLGDSVFARRLVCLVVALLLGGATCSALADDVRPAAVAVAVDPEPDDSQHLLYLGSDRPVFIRLRLRVDGRSYRAVWHEFGVKVFREIDQNADGVLSQDEWRQIPSPDVLMDGGTRGARGTGGDAIDQSPRDGLITLDEFTEYLTSLGSRPLNLQAVGTGQVPGRGYVAPGGGLNVSSQLFERLDVDGDTRLSPEELKGAPQVLARIDFDDDGTFSGAELQQARAGLGTFVPAVSNQVPARPVQFIDLGPLEPAEAIARRLLDQYDRIPTTPDGNPTSATGNDRLSRDEVRFTEELFTRLDQNNDGELDFSEIPEIARNPVAALEWTVRIGRRAPGEKAIEITSLDPGLPVELRLAGEGQATFVLGDTQLELTVELASGGTQLRDIYKQQFKNADSDNNNYLERPEVQRFYFFNQLFDAMDEDGDGKLFEPEVLRYISRREAAAGSRSVMSVADGGRNLFEILDSNRDGRLGSRELLAGAGRLETWDANKDGRLAEGEVPAHFRLSFGPGQPNLPGMPIFFGGQRAPAPGGSTGSGQIPPWFQRMDKNRDGDVSRREFLGTRTVFDRLDANHDGLIDAGEAAAP